MNPSLHVFIIWKTARYMTDEILEDLKEKFELLEVYEIHWSTELFSENMSRFYGVNLPPDAFKEEQYDVGPFLLCIIEDKNPKFGNEETPKGEIRVNLNAYDSKQIYRSWTGGGNNIHSSNTEEETEHDLVLLLGRNLNDIRDSLPNFWDGTIKKLESDLIGAKGWKSTEELFYVLNATVNYLILRGFENISDINSSVINNDIDVLTNQIKQIRFVTNGKKILEEKNQEFHLVKIRENDVLFHVGEQYYDPKWAKKMLEQKILSRDGYFIPNDEDYFYSLLYRALVQKPSIPDNYVEKLYNLSSKLKMNYQRENFSTYEMAIEILDTFMMKIGYEYMSRDYSVFCNSKVVDFAITKREHRIFKEKLRTKKWQEAAAEIYYPDRLFDYKMIANQNRSDFLFLLDIKKDDLALVINADLGQTALPLSRFCNVIALENDPEKIDIMKMIVDQENLKNIQFVKSDVHKTDFETGKFDLVIINNFEKIDTFGNKDQMINQSEILDESYRILKSGGTIYFGAFNKFGLQYLLGENVDGIQDFVYLKNNLAKSIFEAETGEKLRILPHGKKEYEKMVLKSGFKDINFFGNLPDYRLPYTWIDLSTNQTSEFVTDNIYFKEEHDMSNKVKSRYGEKLKYLYGIFSKNIDILYPSYSIVAHK